MLLEQKLAREHEDRFLKRASGPEIIYSPEVQGNRLFLNLIFKRDIRKVVNKQKQTST
jgi:hypothetical protein